MGAFKPLLDLGGRSLLERCVSAFTLAGVDDVVVVTGHRGAEVAEAARALGAHAVTNAAPERGMYSSVQVGAAAVADGTAGFFLLPVDCPLVRPETAGQLARVARRMAAEVVVPVYDGAPGHPPLLDAALRAAILAAEPPGGLRGLLEARAGGSLRVDVADPGVALDADTPDDFARLEAAARGESLPAEARCVELLRNQGASPAVVAHSRAVADAATALAVALNRRDQHLCVPLVTAAALLHDVARARPRHDEAGAALLERLGYARLAPLVRGHMRLPEDAGEDLDEAQIVYLADKLVAEDRYVGLPARFAARREQVAGDPRAEESVRLREREARLVQERVERILGRPLDGPPGSGR
jgi:molybdenum cofactor cytidylyltransferase